MNHEHFGPPDQACDRCIREAHGNRWKEERRKTAAGIILLVVLVTCAMYLLSKYLTEHGSHIP